MEIEQVAAIPAAIAKNSNLRGKFVIAHDDLLHAFVIVAFKGFSPFTRRIVPEDKAMAVEAMVEAVVDAFVGHDRKSRNRSGFPLRVVLCFGACFGGSRLLDRCQPNLTHKHSSRDAEVAVE